MDWRVPLVDLDFDDQEARAVLDVLDHRWITMGAVTERFEGQFAAFVGADYAVAVSNATVALHLACLALGIGPEDEVIVPSLSFVATANAVLYTGAEVRFADIIGPDELNISPDKIEHLITDRTKAIMVMHYAGYPCRMPEIMEIASRHDLVVIEDAAHAPGAMLNGRCLGAWGDVGCFSFFSNKNLATGEGGMLVTNREGIAKKVRLLRSHAMTSVTWDRHRGHAYSYDVVDLGYNYRIDEIRSALGLVQLSKLGANNARRKMLTETYWRTLKNCDLELPYLQMLEDPEIQPGYHILPILLPEGSDRSVFMGKLRTDGVQSSIHYPPIHNFSYYSRRYPGVALPITERAAAREVTLPLYPGMSDDQLSLVIASVQAAL
ncbi:MAG: DegT/DnrJ/EryC1/StrS family aminotransferase [Chloroflexota bacterium]|nr:DegT/DnrJ/EryC1/StrS family aminotransferase [Chloroflexota bacterium]